MKYSNTSPCVRLRNKSSNFAVWFVPQAEIKRLQEANKAARRERQLLFKQQEEIERIRHTTLKLKERLKSAEDTKLVSLLNDYFYSNNIYL